ncbi:MAG: molecular chaperone TorD family protein, partial [Sulfolobus sp.]|nr:molecular chaperone TorD family protein [Sulfolobus sp.]
MEEIESKIQDNIFLQKSILFDFLARSYYYPFKLIDMDILKGELLEVEEILPRICKCQETLDAFLKFKEVVMPIDNYDKLTQLEMQFVNLDKPAFVKYSLYESVQKMGYHDLINAMDLKKIFRKYGMEPAKGEFPDHISLLLSFLSYLYLRLSINFEEKIVKDLEDFKKKHIYNWIPK